MNTRTIDKLRKAICNFLHDLLRVADEENYDRDSFVKVAADMFSTMVEISTFQNFQLEDSDGKNH